MSRSVDLPAWMKNYVKPRPNLKELRSIPKSAKPEKLFTDADTVTTCDKFWQCAESCEHLLQKAETEELLLGLDIDWMRDYKTVLARTSSVHVCSQPNKCYIFDVYSMKALPRAFTLLLRHPHVRLVGHHIINDLRKLGRDFQIDLQPLIEKIEYPSKYSEHTLYCTHGWNLKNVISKGLDLVIRDLSQSSQQQSVLKFPGQVILCKTFSEIGEISDLLLREAEILDDNFILGFDLEWPFSFKAGSGRVALIQICPSQHICYLFHMLEMTSLPKALVLLLKHSNVKLSGLNIANDIRKLGRDFRIDVKSILENNLIELTTFANKKLNTSERWSLDRLVLNQLQLILEKPMNVRVSNWSKEHLSKEQTMYAATDAYASLLCYQHLAKIEDFN